MLIPDLPDLLADEGSEEVDAGLGSILSVRYDMSAKIPVAE